MSHSSGTTMADLRANEAEFRFRYGSDLGGKLDVVGFEGREALSEPFEFTIDLAGAEGEKDLTEELLDGPAELEIALPEGGKRSVFGVMVAVEPRGMHETTERRRYRALLAPKLARLAHVHRSRIFQGMSAPEIIRQILDEHGVEQDWPLTREYARREYTVQYQESDLDFVQRIAADEGIFYFFRHEDGKHTVVLGDAREVHQEIAGGVRVPFRAPSGMAAEAEHVFALARRHEVRSSAAELRDYDFKRPKLDLTARADTKDDRADGALEHYEHPGGYDDPDAGKKRAAIRLEELRARAVVASGASVCRRLEAGRVFELVEHPDFHGRYLVVAVRHRGEQPQVLGAEPAAGRKPEDDYRNEIECIPVTTPFRPARRARPRATIETATVVGPPGEEIYVDERGRVKVQFHWHREGARDEKSSAWIRVSQPWAGAGWGFLFVPRVGMEVIVQYDGGDPDRPLVTNCLANGAHPPPLALPDHKTQSVIRTHSTPNADGANELRFEDAAGSEQVYLHAQKDLDEVIEHDHASRVGRHQTLRVAGNRTKDVARNEVTAIGADRTETVGANEAVSIGAQRKHLVKGSDLLTVETNRAAEIALTDSVTAKNKRTTVAETYEIEARQKFLVRQAGSSFVLTRETAELLTPDFVHVQNPGVNFEMTKDGVLAIFAQSEVSIECGGCKVHMKDGKIEISAPQGVKLGVGQSVVELSPTDLKASASKVNTSAIGLHEIAGGIVKIN